MPQSGNRVRYCRESPGNGHEGRKLSALFSFATAVPAYNTYAVVEASLHAAHGAEMIKEKLSITI